MKTLDQYLNEALSDEQRYNVTRYKIDDIMDELETNMVSKTRRNEIKKFYETVLGPAPYYCISPHNTIGKSALKLVNGHTLLEIEDLDWYDKMIADPDYADDKEWVNNFQTRKKEAIKHNKKIAGYKQEDIEYIKKLQDRLNASIKKPFKFGRRGHRNWLTAGIAELNDKYVSIIIQDHEAEDAYDFNHPEGRVTYYFAASDLD